MNGGADVELDGVCRSFAGADGGSVDVLKDVSLHVKAAESVAIMGPSGSGKTTLLQLIGAMDGADRGDIRVNGRSLGAMDERGRAAFRNREVGFVFQAHHLLPQLTALENVLVPAWSCRDVAAYAERAAHLLRRVGLGERLDRFPGQLSGGERQRVAVARALVMSPGLVLADEPTGALDQRTAHALVDLLLELNTEEHATLILVTHAQACAQRMARQIALDDGKLVESGCGAAAARTTE